MAREGERRGLPPYLILGPAVVLVDGADEAVAVEERVGLGAGAGGERHRAAVEGAELRADGLVEEEELRDGGHPSQRLRGRTQSRRRDANELRDGGHP